MDERDAVERLKRGDIGGLEALVRQHYTRAVRAADLVLRAPPRLKASCRPPSCGLTSA